ncbi:hypothetical protein EmuJ_000974300 [Echinococcus multilocularis]|uniref:Uncharacterized protein n=1 Tax=Echinococcus multilocularis TaxID=6211 RepID=A0A068YBZ3_ECHMU|nr:hypothetical protein EmuJ_000974300 [Echinococcus multilocularis]
MTTTSEETGETENATKYIPNSLNKLSKPVDCGYHWLTGEGGGEVEDGILAGPTATTKVSHGEAGRVHGDAPLHSTGVSYDIKGVLF